MKMLLVKNQADILWVSLRHVTIEIIVTGEPVGEAYH